MMQDIKDLDLTITLRVHSKKHNCNIEYMVSEHEIKEQRFNEILKYLFHEINDYCKGIENAISKREESKNSQGVF